MVAAVAIRGLRIVGPVALRLSIRAAQKLNTPIGRKVGSITVKWVRKRPQVLAQRRQRESQLGENPVINGIGLWKFERIVKPIFAVMRIELSSTTQTAESIVKSVEQGSFELTPMDLATIYLGGAGVHDQIMFEVIREFETRLATTPRGAVAIGAFNAVLFLRDPQAF